MARAGDDDRQLAAILESESSEEEEKEEDEDATMVQHPPCDQEVAEAEERLAELEQASQALLAELSALEMEFEVERTCRQRAEAYAAQVKQENKQLKRLSSALTAPLAPPEEEPPEEDPDLYGQQLEDPQEKISWLLAQKKDLTVQVQELKKQNQDLQDQLESERGEQQRLRAALGASQRALRSFKRVSQIVTQDYCEVMQQLELEQDLRLHAEAFAHEMLVQQKEANRQSTILLQSGGPSAQLLAALGEVGRLTRALEEARQEQQQRVKDLAEQLGRRPEPEELDGVRAALAAAEEEKLQLKKRLVELEEEVGLLREKLDQNLLLKSQIPEPPPLPPPPPPPAVPTDPLAAIRQRKGLGNPQQGKPDADDVKARAVQEMMERIKNGVVLRPAKKAPHGQGSVSSKRRSAVLELQGILGAPRRVERTLNRRRSSHKGRDRQLESILQRRRRVLDACTASPHPPDPPPQDPCEDAAEAAGRTDAGDKDIGTAPAGRSPGGGEGVLFRARAVGGLPRTRPLIHLAEGSGGPG